MGVDVDVPSRVGDGDVVSVGVVVGSVVGVVVPEVLVRLAVGEGDVEVALREGLGEGEDVRVNVGVPVAVPVPVGVCVGVVGVAVHGTVLAVSGEEACVQGTVGTALAAAAADRKATAATIEAMRFACLGSLI